ncbi:dual 3',5'-cyclic-AMP and -GMP phosphodiesterase 11 [Parasteatoda tepidariorum]
MRRVPRTLRKGGGSDRPERDQEKASSGSGPSLWRFIWQPAWHPRGPVNEIHKNPSHSMAMGESSDGKGDRQQTTGDGPISKEEIEKVESWLDEHPHFVQDYFVRKASRQMVDSWLLSHSAPQGLVQENSSSASSPTTSSSGATTPVRKISAHEFERSGILRPIVTTTVDGIPTFLTLPLPGDIGPPISNRIGRKSRQELRALDERELIFELVKDICNDLEIRSLCHKILQNVSILTDADRCSLFLVRGEKGDQHQYLISQLFDVSCSSTMEQMQQKEEIRIPWGTGIVGYVAESKESLNIPDCYQVFSRYLQFCGIGLRNAELYERSELENKRNQVLLDLARMVFEEQSTIEHIVYRIMTHTQSLLQCERCQVLLVDETTKTFSRVFDLDINDMTSENAESRTSPFEGRFPINVGITGYVATTGETLNISNVHKDERFDPAVDDDCSFFHHSILCMPIRNASSKIIGVSQLINKISGEPFNKNDEHIFEAFAIFCGMGLQNTQMYEKAIKAMAKTKVTLEVLSYHATAPLDEAKQLSKSLIPSTHVFKLQDLKFNDFSLDDPDMLKACLRMFMDLDLIERFHIKYDVLCRWLLSVRKNYRQVTYHNWRHAFNVSQMMFAVLTITKLWHVFGEVETLALLIACLCHDLDHRGTNNSFQIKSCSPLAQLYSTSTMEHHHFDQCIMILNSEGNQILSHLSPDEYSYIVHVLEDAILATDLAVYFRRRGIFFKLVETGNYTWKREDNRELLRAMLMTACDIAAITKPWDIQRVVAELVASEFFQQGDIEKEQLKIQPIDMMNRDKKEELPLMQVRFIDSICAPVYEAFSNISEQLKPLMDGVRENRAEWLKLAQERNLCVCNDN